MNDTDRLRAYVGERIPITGTDQDTLFTADEVTDLLTNFQGPFAGTPQGLYLAAAEGWERKASYYADQADHEQGGSRDSLSQLNKQALVEATRYRNLAYQRNVPRIGRIVRPGTTTY